jgi:hypothetical protein
MTEVGGVVFALSATTDTYSWDDGRGGVAIR